eukprot:6107813-Alexandrium_andersonii.AAC.1
MAPRGPAESACLGTAVIKLVQRSQRRGLAGDDLVGAVAKVLDATRAGKLRAEAGKPSAGGDDGALGVSWDDALAPAAVPN